MTIESVRYGNYNKDKQEYDSMFYRIELLYIIINDGRV